MGTIFWIIVTLLVFNAFLIMLNTFLHKTWKIHIDLILGLFQAVILVIVFIFYGWKVGLLVFSGCFILGAIIISPVAFFTSKLLNK